MIYQKRLNSMEFIDIIYNRTMIFRLMKRFCLKMIAHGIYIRMIYWKIEIKFIILIINDNFHFFMFFIDNFEIR